MTTIIQNIGPILGLLFVAFLVWKLLLTEDGGKTFTSKIHKGKVGIADIFIIGFAFLEGLVAANMGHNILGDTYATRFANHMMLSFGGGYAGFISIKEIIDAAKKTSEKNSKGLRRFTIGYLIVQWLQPLIYLTIAISMPLFNLMIIAKGVSQANGVNDFIMLSYLFGFEETSASTFQILSKMSDLTVRSTLVVATHIFLTLAVALGSVDESETEIEEDKKGDKSKVKDKSENKESNDEELDQAKEIPKFEPNEAYEELCNLVPGLNPLDFVNELAAAKKKNSPEADRIQKEVLNKYGLLLRAKNLSVLFKKRITEKKEELEKNPNDNQIRGIISSLNKKLTKVEDHKTKSRQNMKKAYEELKLI